jgi:hypothetical protein
MQSTNHPANRKWGGRRGSNPRRPESQSGALPAELRPPSCLLSTGGAPGRNRTCNRRLRRPVLYPVELRALTNQRITAPIVIFQADARVRANRIGSARGLYRTLRAIKAAIGPATQIPTFGPICGRLDSPRFSPRLAATAGNLSLAECRPRRCEAPLEHDQITPI